MLRSDTKETGNASDITTACTNTTALTTNTAAYCQVYLKPSNMALVDIFHWVWATWTPVDGNPVQYADMVFNVKCTITSITAHYVPGV